MFSNQLAVAALAGTCVAAAAGGGYFAARQNTASAATPPPQAAELAGGAGASEVPAAGLGEQLATTGHAAAPARAAVAPAPTARPASARAAAASSNRPATGPGTPAAAPQGRPAAAQALAAPAPVAVVPAQSTDLPVLVPPAAASQPGAWEPPAPEESAFREVVVPADAVVGLEITSAISSDTAVVEDDVEARVVRDVRADGDIAIPAGSRALGSVVEVERGGRFREQARLGIRFHTLVLADNTRVPVSTETIYRLGNAPGRATAAKIGGGAVAGAILGGILGGSKGAAIGASSGAGAGTAVVYAGDRSEATFASGLEVTARFLADVPVTLPAR